jgi:energy-coupling factor transporter ATP-binding protein EcfA2
MSLRVLDLVVGDRRRRLGPVSLQLRPGERVLVTGRSGSGKSLLIETLAGVRPHLVQNGHASLFRPCGVVFGENGLELDRTVLDNVLVHPAPAPHPSPTTSTTHSSPRAREERARELLERCGLTGCAQRLPGTLSGGQRRRVAVARALLDPPATLLLDDPTAGLDPQTAHELLTTILDQAPTASILVASSDVDVVAPFVDRALWLDATGTATVMALEALPAAFRPRPLPTVVAVC